MLSRSNWAHVESVDIIIGANIVCHGDWSMVSPPTCQEVIDVTSTRPLSKDFDVKRFGLNTTSHKSVCLQVCLYTSQADQDIQCQRNNT